MWKKELEFSLQKTAKELGLKTKAEVLDKMLLVLFATLMQLDITNKAKEEQGAPPA